MDTKAKMNVWVAVLAVWSMLGRIHTSQGKQNHLLTKSGHYCIYCNCDTWLVRILGHYLWFSCVCRAGIVLVTNDN